MEQGTEWHFFVMIFASYVVFMMVLWMVLNGQEFTQHTKKIKNLSLLVVVIGMLLGKFGANVGLPWWIYYPVPMLMTVIIPPLALRLSLRKAAYYWILSSLSAPLIHVCFSFFLGWTEYLPFWSVPFIGTILN